MGTAVTVVNVMREKEREEKREKLARTKKRVQQRYKIVQVV